MWNQNTKKSPRIKVAIFKCTRNMGLNIFGCLNSSFSLFLFCHELMIKNVMAYARIQLNLPLRSIRASTLLAGLNLPPPSIRTLWMTPKVSVFVS